MRSFDGIWIPLVTPFHDGKIDFPALQALARSMSDAGVSGLVACGSTAEAAALDDAEQLAVLDAILDAVPGCPVVMGLAGNRQVAMLEKMQKIQQRPVAGLLIPAPYYIRPSQEGLRAFYLAMADAAEAPVIVYNIPYRSGVNIDAATILALADHERIVAVKDCGGGAAATMDLIAHGGLQILAGEDEQIFTTLCLGGSGAITAAAHIRPDLFVRVAQLVQAQRLVEAREQFYELLPLIRLLFAEPNPAVIKTALAMMGMLRDELRAPMLASSPALHDGLRRELSRLGCL
ncbi:MULTISPECIES: 4-hydroxy-tetrahydrodipicolinate synthase [unclassified Herbaspirillum]|uniref:4-hydroxy-tetrahydrodipicolinate synthase n=1 Tax=unclassified Herbaspirillum TaxID=2624150 RepID=UPI000E2F3FC9|nr:MULTISPECIES: 4-hydroxy-tetrahydrodipicolinate synthase [unclassified Herbaspirillum]RFB68147.1 4-hydroxy-tetrahydrodipicolinate synthase [Herbaspirillum sp. 3R-3a1]TFI06595.1 4-hydroxy-tetrahydrodipicolinate synthase [Herbaspirillum sp. 3R11]TFI13793.1 4-hydroxy-tetrahydrodipicolinate synthase [Herbaspirillum sp. 3R-11]TFI29237.1 4-hydroxy-tetrahydrodipicolinate synthase [Herbaspirillum sp. 3C11]